MNGKYKIVCYFAISVTLRIWHIHRVVLSIWMEYKGSVRIRPHQVPNYRSQTPVLIGLSVPKIIGQKTVSSSSSVSCNVEPGGNMVSRRMGNR